MYVYYDILFRVCLSLEILYTLYSSQCNCVLVAGPVVN